MATIKLQVTLKDIEVEDPRHPGLTRGRLASLLEQFLRETMADYPRTETQRTLQGMICPGINAAAINVDVIKRRPGTRSNYADGTRS